MEKENLENRAESSEFQLIEGDASKYYGKYVAFNGFNPRKIIAFGKDPGKVIQNARKKGAGEPVIVYVHDPAIPYIFNAA